MYESGFDLAKRLFDDGEQELNAFNLEGMPDEYRRGFYEFAQMIEVLELVTG